MFIRSTLQILFPRFCGPCPFGIDHMKDLEDFCVYNIFVAEYFCQPIMVFNYFLLLLESFKLCLLFAKRSAAILV